MGELLSPSDVRALADRLGLRPSKSRGQNFVHDQNTVRRIVRAAQLPPDAVVLEVGPGLGSLTLGLLGSGADVLAIEIDATLAAELPATVAAHAGPDAARRLRVVHADALAVDALPGAPPTALVANLPYNVAVPVLLHLLERLPSLQRGLVMVQTEVALRLAAAPGSRVYGVPSAKLAWYASAAMAGSVSRTVFWPVPNVDSSLLRFTRRPPPTGASRADVFAVIDAAFAQRRKMLRSALASWAGSPMEAQRLLSSVGIDPTTRGEMLDIAAYSRLAAAKT
jgi:16S rRNA (adenine1518-N6/adenine1519-N6)-dimethyltransferase